MIIKCENGHWYDNDVYRVCPHCKQSSERLSLVLDDVEEDDHTISISEIDVSLGEQLDNLNKTEKTFPANIVSEADIMPINSDGDKTIAFGYFQYKGINPVVGWLVCLNGGEQGKDYRLHAGKNFVGRGTSMDVVIVEDKTISRDKHCSITYESKKNVFYFSSEEGNLSYCNGNLVENAIELKENDKIQIGSTELIFIPYCKEERKWEAKES